MRAFLTAHPLPPNLRLVTMSISNRVKKSVAWHTNYSPAAPPNPTGFIGMDNAENWLIRPDELPTMKESIQKHFSYEDLDYQRSVPGAPELRQRTANYMNKFFLPHTPVLADQIACQGGAMEILDSLLFSLCDEDEGLLIDAPYWDGFANAANLRNSDHLFSVPLAENFSHPEKLVEHYAKAIESAPYKIRGIIVCNPQNPTGHIYPTPFLEAVLKFCEAHDIHYVSDEIYGMTTWGAGKRPHTGSSPIIYESAETKFTSVLSFDLKKLEVNPARVHVVYGISKDLGSSGLRLGFLITQNNPKLREGVYTVERYTVSAATTIMTEALFSDLLVTESWLSRTRILLRLSADYIGDFMIFHDIDYYRPVAGVVMFARLGGRSATRESDLELWKKISAAGAALAIGYQFKEEQPGWFRITWALLPKALIEGLRRIEDGLQTERKFPQDPSRLVMNVPCGLAPKERAGNSSNCTIM